MSNSRFWLIGFGSLLLCAAVVYLIVKPKGSPVAAFDVSQLLREYGAGTPLGIPDPTNHEHVLQEVDRGVKIVNAANAKYRDKWIEVNGIVFEVGMTSEQHLFVSLRDRSDPHPSFVVMCSFPSEIRSIEYKAGDPLRIRGICMGCVGNVILRDCVVVADAP